MSGTISELQLTDFSGGLNLRDAPSEMTPNQSPALLNVTLDNRGAVVKRLGFTLVSTPPGSPTSVNQNAYFWPSGNKMIFKFGTKLYSLSGVTLTLIHTFTDDSHVDFADFLGELIVIHETDAVLSWTGVALDALVAVANSPRGLTIETWQNALWCAGNPLNNTLVTRSDLGAITFPVDVAAGLVTVNMRDVNDQKVINLTAAGWDGLLACKDDVIHRIEDPSTGGYVTINRDMGTVSNKSVIAYDGIFFTLNDRGIAASNGLRAFKLISDKIEPIFANNQINLNLKDNWCTGVFDDRLFFNISQTGGTENDLMIEFKPEHQFFVTHDIKAQAMAQAHEDSRLTYHVNASLVFQTFNGGSDNGVAIESVFQTAWFQPAGFHKSRWRRMRLQGRSADAGLTMNVLKDFEVGEPDEAGTVVPIDLTYPTVTWDSTTWLGSVWAGTRQERFDATPGVGVGRSISLVFTETSELTETTPKLNVTGSAQTVGAWSINAVMLSYVPLGLS
tara:strand:- start:19604 stop:21115 length:1512 start_codon:yes stop_codon:yes gene_type:complete